MNRTHVVTLIAALVAGSAVACGGTAAEPQTQTSASAVTRAPVGQNTHGLVKVFGEALGEVGLRADQRVELEKLAADAETRHAPLMAGRKELMGTLATQVEQGRLDRDALEAKMAKLRTDGERIRVEDGAALGKVHALLDKEQRAAFADALEARFHSKHGAHGVRDHAKGLGKLAALADELKLTEEQRTQIFATLKEARGEMRAKFAERRAAHAEKAEGAEPPNGVRAEGAPKFEHHRRGPKLTDAFRADKFDAAAFAGPRMAHAKVKGMLGHGVAVGEKILPLLTPEQRQILAAKIRARADGDPAEMLDPAAH